MKVRLLAVSFVLGWLVGYVGVAKPQAKAVLFSLPASWHEDRLGSGASD